MTKYSFWWRPGTPVLTFILYGSAFVYWLYFIFLHFKCYFVTKLKIFQGDPVFQRIKTSADDDFVAVKKIVKRNKCMCLSCFGQLMCFQSIWLLSLDKWIMKSICLNGRFTCPNLHELLLTNFSLLCIISSNIRLPSIGILKGISWVGPWKCSCLVTLFCYQLMIKQSDTTAFLWFKPLIP